MARIIVVTSGKGGVGKTTIASNLAAMLSKKGYRVVLFDADLGLNNSDLVSGVENMIIYDVVDVIEGRCRVKQALIRHPDFCNLYILTSSHSTPERYVSPQAMKIVLDGIAPVYDFIIVDSPAGIEEGFHRAVAVSNEAIVVTTPHVLAVRDADKTITALKSYKLEKVMLVVNRVRGDFLAEQKIADPKSIAELLKIPLLGVIEENGKIMFSHIGEEKSFKILAENLVAEKQKIIDPSRKYLGFFGAIKRVLKRG